MSIPLAPDLRVSDDAPDPSLARVCQVQHEEDQARAAAEERARAERAYWALLEREAEEKRKRARERRVVAGVEGHAVVLKSREELEEEARREREQRAVASRRGGYAHTGIASMSPYGHRGYIDESYYGRPYPLGASAHWPGLGASASRYPYYGP